MIPLGNAASLPYVIPELALGAGAALALAWELFAAPRTRRVGAMTLAIAGAGVSLVAALVALTGHARFPVPALLFYGQLACDPFACVFRALFAAVAVVVLLAQLPMPAPLGRASTGELAALLLAACLGMDLLAMGRTFLIVYLGVELVTVASVVLAGDRAGDRRAGEGALKLAITSGLATAAMLVGVGWIYGLSHAIDFPGIAERAATLTREQGHLPNALAVSIACVVAGLGYKVAAAPFHMAAIDAFEAAPTPVAAFLAVAPPSAGLAALVRFFREGLAATALPAEAQAPWPVLIGGLALAAMAVGTLGALGQTSVKRYLAFTCVAQAGTMLFAFAALDDEGIAALGFYVLGYAAMGLGAFLVVDAVTGGAPGADSIEALRGLATRAPAMALAMTVFLLSLVGLPPFMGFVGKTYVLLALLRAPGDYRTWDWLLASSAALSVAVSLVQASRVARAMFAEAPGGEGRAPVHAVHGALVAALALPTVALGLWWGPLHELLLKAMTMMP